MSQSSKNSPPGQGEQPGDASSIVQGLSDTAQTIGGSLQAMQRALVGNMQQAAQMTLSMNKMMEELVRRSVQVSVFARRPEAGHKMGTILQLAIHNRSPIPLQHTRVKLWFGSRHAGGGPIRMRVANARDGSEGLAFGRVDGELPAALADAGEPFAETERPVDIGSGATAETEVLVEPGVLAQINGRIAVEFVSPGTGRVLSVGYRFGIHLLQLIDCSFAHDESAVSAEAGELCAVADAQSVEVDVGRARATFAVPPADGVSIGSLLVMRAEGETLALRVDRVSEDAQTAICEWITAQSGSDLLAVRQQLAEELGPKPIA
ncbi:hypothetical protein IWW50_001791 [Coemansia erecta]|nr:hypothetical protein GGF43_002913 [Coemansia sp. RSA 2618]KAJ2827643.1 hypothetical protein IWW50_001791 [Coemansia erecta]